MSRWTYRTQTVTAGENKQDVRELTAGECRQFTEANKKAKEAPGDGAADQVITLVVSLGATNPTMTPEEVDSMPADLRAACFGAIIAVTGKDKIEKKATLPEVP